MEKPTRQRGELGFLMVLTLFSLVCFIASMKLFLSAPKLSGEGTVPVLCALVMLIMCAILFAQSRSAGEKLPLPQKLRESLAYLFPGKVGWIVLYCILYALLLSVLGFGVSTFLFLALSMLTLDRAKKLRMLLISAVTVVCVYVIFQSVFQVQLP